RHLPAVEAIVTITKPLLKAKPCNRARYSFLEPKTSPSLSGNSQSLLKDLTTSSTILRRYGGHSWCVTKTGRPREENREVDIATKLTTKRFYIKLATARSI